MPDVELDDRPVFERQRRNVMVACLVVLAIVALHLQYQAVRILEVTAGTPENFDIAWATLILYFVWRLFQSEAPRKLLFKPSDRFMKFAQTAVKKSKQIEEYKVKALQQSNEAVLAGKPVVLISEYGKAATSEPLKAVGVTFEAVQNFANTTAGVGYDLAYTVQYNNNSSQPVGYHLTLKKYGWINVSSWIKGYLLASWRDQYFSEYLLPFWLGFGCIAYCIYNHVVNH